jgi:chorismate mutase
MRQTDAVDASDPAWRAPATDRAPSVDGEGAADANFPAVADAAAPADAGSPGGTEEGDAAGELARLRGEIEAVDRQIVGLIARRVALARRVGPLKQALGMPILDPPREAAIVRRAGELARDAGLPDEDVRYVFWHLVGLGRRVQLEQG